ncbi:hypothetical protein BGZ65_007692 [Modicella reniformis]|uniref:Transmembrane protein n=1 Tax=Modicella reniformis TaxID=1440133 RepID=A0A9P6M8C9_9FUNG|nr:hypothetical protein BGZ65_007692 [Modicella reniformis]
MGLRTAIITFETIILFFSLLAFGLDMYLISTYIENHNVVFLWRFYVQTGITGVWILFFLASLIVILVQHRRHRYQPTSPPGPSNMGSVTDRRSMGQVVLSVSRVLFSLGLVVAMLYITVRALINENRSVLVLPNPRESPQYKSLNENFSSYDPKNLLHCPGNKSGDSLWLLCDFDRSIISAMTIVAVLAVFEALFKFVHENRPGSVKY